MPLTQFFSKEADASARSLIDCKNNINTLVAYSTVQEIIFNGFKPKYKHLSLKGAKQITDDRMTVIA